MAKTLEAPKSVALTSAQVRATVAQFEAKIDKAQSRVDLARKDRTVAILHHDAAGEAAANAEVAAASAQVADLQAQRADFRVWETRAREQDLIDEKAARLADKARKQVEFDAESIALKAMWQQILDMRDALKKLELEHDRRDNAQWRLHQWLILVGTMTIDEQIRRLRDQNPGDLAGFRGLADCA
jgi:hypothetical protein